MLCSIIDIRGDYAIVKYDDTGIESEVAIALLPFGVDIGDRLRFEDFDAKTKKIAMARLTPAIAIFCSNG